MSGKGNSKAKTSSSASTVSSVVNDIDNRVYSTMIDAGTVEASRDVAVGSLYFAGDAMQEASDVATRAVDTALGFGTDTVTEAFDFGRSALDTSRDVFSDTAGAAFNFGRDALDAVTDNGYKSFEFAREANEGSLGFAAGIQRDFAGVVGDVINFATDTIGTVGSQARGLAEQSMLGSQSLSRMTSESTDDKMIKFGMIAFAAIAAIMIFARK
jgi:hypothetical protein